MSLHPRPGYTGPCPCATGDGMTNPVLPDAISVRLDSQMHRDAAIVSRVTGARSPTALVRAALRLAALASQRLDPSVATSSPLTGSEA